MQSQNRIRIHGIEKPLQGADAQWVQQTIRGFQRDGIVPCVEISLGTEAVNLRLATCNCATGGGGGRPPNSDEQEVIDLWRHFGLHEPGAELARVWGFLQRLQQALR